MNVELFSSFATASEFRHYTYLMSPNKDETRRALVSRLSWAMYHLWLGVLHLFHTLLLLLLLVQYLVGLAVGLLPVVPWGFFVQGRSPRRLRGCFQAWKWSSAVVSMRLSLLSDAGNSFSRTVRSSSVCDARVWDEC